jgi:hypothetical protein
LKLKLISASISDGMLQIVARPISRLACVVLLGCNLDVTFRCSVSLGNTSSEAVGASFLGGVLSLLGNAEASNKM